MESSMSRLRHGHSYLWYLWDATIHSSLQNSATLHPVHGIAVVNLNHEVKMHVFNTHTSPCIAVLGHIHTYYLLLRIVVC